MDVANVNLADILIQSKSDKIKAKGQMNETTFEKSIQQTVENDVDRCGESSKEKSTKLRAYSLKGQENLNQLITKQITQEELEALEEMLLALIAEYLQQPLEQVVKTVEEQEISLIELIDTNQLQAFLLTENNDILEVLEDEVLYKQLKEILGQAETYKQVMQQAIKNIEVIEDTGNTEDIALFESQGQGPLQEEAKVLEDQLVSMPKVTTIVNETAEMSIEEQTVPVFLGDRVITQTVQLSKSTIQSQMAKYMPIEDQIIKQIEVMQTKEITTLNMQLEPKELGQMTIELLTESGGLVGQIKVETEDVKEMIDARLEELKKMLEQTGLTIDGLEVSVSKESTKQHMHQQQQKSSKRIQEIIDKHLQEQEQQTLEQIEDTVLTEMDIKV